MALPGQEDIDITLKMGSNNQHVVGGGLRQGVRVGGERGRRSVAVVDRQGRLCGWTWMTDCHFVDGEEGRGGGMPVRCLQNLRLAVSSGQSCATASGGSSRSMPTTTTATARNDPEGIGGMTRTVTMTTADMSRRASRARASSESSVWGGEVRHRRRQSPREQQLLTGAMIVPPPPFCRLGVSPLLPLTLDCQHHCHRWRIIASNDSNRKYENDFPIFCLSSILIDYIHI